MTDPSQRVDHFLRLAREQTMTDQFWIPGPNHYEVRSINAHGQVSVEQVEIEVALQCVTRIKVLAGLLTYVNREAQDGSIQFENGGECRAAIMPSLHGERVALRFGTAQAGLRHLDELGLDDKSESLLGRMLDCEQGLLILTGPTGCGKSTTIYALLRELLRRGEDPASIITIEDPIEARLDGVTQTEVNQGTGWDYAAGLRAALRHRVKTLVVGELRDIEVTRVALDAALSGHRVITTYHAADLPGVFARMLHQGLEPFLVGCAISGVFTQRIVPQADGRVAVRGQGVMLDDTLRDLLATKPSLEALRQAFDGVLNG